MLRRFDTTESTPNLTPMLDVVFIMLIFFIVTATFVAEVGIDTNPPEPNHNPPPIPAENILARIDQNNRVIIDGRFVDIRNVRSNLARLHAENPNASLIIAPHPLSSTQSLIGVMDAARTVGVDGIQLAEH